MDSSSKGYNFVVYKGSKDGRIIQGTTHRDSLQGEEVLLRITHSSLCGTDEHYKTTDMCLGHEGAGVVEALGPGVKNLKVLVRQSNPPFSPISVTLLTNHPPSGTAVAFGWQRSSCGSCTQCTTNLETFCPKRGAYGLTDLDVGSMASHTVFRESFLFVIPAPLSNEAAAALMCGGATVFNVLDMFDVRPTQRVGVVGFGGLGHLAVQFAAKWGCQVVVFSATGAKREEALRLGAHEFYVVEEKGLTEFEEGVVGPIDHLLVTTSAQPSWPLYLSVMASPGTVYPLTVAFGEDLCIPYGPFLLSGLRIQASIIASKAILRRMLSFAAFHGIGVVVQRYDIDLDGIERAMADLREGKMKFKGILWAGCVGACASSLKFPSLRSGVRIGTPGDLRK